MTSINFKQVGAIQQYSGFLVKIGRLIDGLVIFFTLYFMMPFLRDEWNNAYMIVAIMGVLFFELISSFCEFYRSWRIVRLRYEILDIFLYWAVTCFILTFILFFWYKNEEVNSNIIFYWFFFSFVCVAVWRCCLRLILRYVRAFGYDQRNACFIGANDTALKLYQNLKSHRWIGINFIGFFDDRESTPSRPLSTPDGKIAGNIDDLLVHAVKGRVDIVYICLPMAAEKRIKTLIDHFSDTTTSIYFCPSFIDFDLLNARWDDVFGQPVISVVESPFSGYVGFIKRLEDLCLCMIILPLIAVPMAVISIMIKATSKGPVLYKQKRYGLNGKEFMIWKFRSMTTCENEHEFVQATKNDNRITPLGAFLRKTSLDEIPQFINVLKGDMSVIGPRPHPIKLNEQHRKMVHRYMLRHIIKPGITGWAQVNGCRGETEDPGKMERRIEHDLFYIKNWSFLLDIKIFFKTFFTALFDKNAY